ncbi:MAG: tRNA lysidine(34) synthetase TilS [Candidatus Cohnella colombiensis]|uniref:tRNA(Ile)-lysidine synthase n=1 Tax=Candidatus Cohnella colombiensis TaxID=3121368 RepID=A0AA95JAF3_9BACL|nr:MAG: tRNA lysidine(34) synthetase TilS [Cohnella sp.]
MQPREEWTERLMADAKAEGWWCEGATVVIAVSGGPDSMALLHLLYTMSLQTHFRVVVAHANHQFRGAESDAEAILVRRIAQEWGMTFEMAELNMPDYIAQTGMNAQSASREKRYQFLHEVAERYGSHTLLLGHHAGDQAETLLMRILRGTGPGGLAGIPYRRIDNNLELIRPLLRITKDELLSYCERYNIPYAIDSSNLDTHYFRNEVRLTLLPMLEAYNPQIQASLVRLADMAAVDDDYMGQVTSAVFQQEVTADGAGYRLSRESFSRLHVALQRRLIKLILSLCSNSEQTLEFRMVEEIVAALSADRPAVCRMDYGAHGVLRREYDEVYLGPPREESHRYNYVIQPSTTAFEISESGTTVVLERLDGAAGTNSKQQWEAFFDEDLLQYPLHVRNREPGDVIAPYRLNGTKKVQDMFVDLKVPRSKRDLVPLVVDCQGNVLWIPSIRRSRHALVSEQTRSTLHMTFIGLEM